MVQPIVRGQLRSQLPTPVNFRERQALELEDFPEYVADMTLAQRQAIETLAIEIIRSNDTNDPIFEFRVEGHADIARRIANPAERKWFEDNISSERAQNAFDLLADALKRRGGDALAQKITRGSKSFGLGTQNLKIPNASTEAEFRKNRRVVIIVRQVTFIPPPPPPPPPPSSIIEDRFTVQLVRSGVVCVGDFGVESTTVIATLAIRDKIDHKKAEFSVHATGGGFGGGPIPVSGTVTTDAGAEVPFKTFRRTRDVVDLKAFAGMVTIFVNGGVSLGPVSKGGALSISFDGLQSNGANTMPSIVPLPGGSSNFSGASIDFGSVAVGALSIKGDPFDD